MTLGGFAVEVKMFTCFAGDKFNFSFPLHVPQTHVLLIPKSLQVADPIEQ
jgi:hypothetical protein